MRELVHLAAARDGNVRGPLRPAARERNRAIVRNRELTARVRTIERAAADSFHDSLDFPVQRQAPTLVTDLSSYCTYRLRPSRAHDRIVDRAIERRRQRMRIAAVEAHQIELGILIAEVLIFEAEIRDRLAVGDTTAPRSGRYAWSAPASRRRERYAIDLGVHRLALPVLAAIAGDEHALAIRRPRDRTVFVVRAERQLPRCTAVAETTYICVKPGFR
jgi:hypothetical protein